MGKSGLVGLNNLGNTCYMNASLQCLRNLMPLTRFILNSDSKQNSSNELVDSYFRFVRHIWNCNVSSFSPGDLKTEFGKYKREFSGFGQQDAQEFTNYLLDSIHETLGVIKNNKEGKKVKRSIISDIFFGKYKSTVICENCSNKSIVHEDFMFLTLSITKSFTESIALLSKTDELNNDNLYKCDKCRKETKAVKNMEIVKMPRVLIIYLKRFNNRQKIGDFMDIPTFFDADGIDGAGTYELVGVINHFGALGGGHYNANVKINGSWHNFDDSHVGDLNKANVITNNAYVLFYERK